MKIVTVVLAVVVALSAPALAQVPGSHIRDIIQKEVENKRSKSIIVGIIDSTGTQIISAGVLSDIDQRQPDGNTIYEIGSITKVFTGLLLANMSLKQEVRLQDLTAQWLPKKCGGQGFIFSEKLKSTLYHKRQLYCLLLQERKCRINTQLPGWCWITSHQGTLNSS